MEEKEYIATGVPGLIRDPKTKAIINTNDQEYQRILETRRKAQEVNDLKSEVDDLKNDISDIKAMLTQLLSK